MRPSALAGALALVALALAPAADANAGGTPAPLRSGGAAYGDPLPVPDAHPIAQRLAPTPREITSGDTSPLIAVRVRQRGVTRVRARLVVLRMPGNRPAARISLGWLKTGQATTVPLPETLKLRTGRYLVRLHVKDPRGNTLARSATYPGRARIIVRHRKPAPAVAPPPAVAPELAPAVVPEPAVAATPVPLVPAPAPSPGGPAVFPIAGAFDFGGADARFGAGREGHIHEGQDIIAAAGTPVVAPYARADQQDELPGRGRRRVRRARRDRRARLLLRPLPAALDRRRRRRRRRRRPGALPGRRDRRDGRRMRTCISRSGKSAGGFPAACRSIRCPSC